MPRYSDEGLKRRFSDEALQGEVPTEVMQGYLPQASEPTLEQPLALPPVQTYTEGDDAFLKGRDGRIVKVPLGLADRYVSEQGYSPADVLEVEKAKKEAPSAFGAAAKAFGGGLASGIESVARLPVASFDAMSKLVDKAAPGAGAAMYAVNPLLAAMGPEEREAFLAATSPSGNRAALAAAADMVPEYASGGNVREGAAKEYYKSLDAAKREHDLFPTLTAVAEGLGQTVGAAPYAAPMPAMGIAGAAGFGAAEGGAFGALSEYDQAALDGRPVNVENIINSGLLGAAIGGVASGTLTAAGKGLKALSNTVDEWSAGTTHKMLDERIGQARKAFTEADDDASKFYFKTEIEQAEFDKKVLQVMEAAGPNPAAQQKAAEKYITEQTTEIKNALGEMKPSDWERMSHPDVSGAKAMLHKEATFEGATDAVTNGVNKLMQNTEDLVEPLRKAPLKKEWVKTNLDNSPEIPNVFESTQGLIKKTNQSLYDMTEELGGQSVMNTANARSTIKQLKQSMKVTRDKITLANSPEEAYIAADALRRDLHAKQEFLGNAMRRATGGNLQERQALEILHKHVKKAYLDIAEDLADPSTFGKQGAAQRLVNGPGTGWVSLINSDRVALKHFVEIVDRNIDGEITRATKGKVHSYLSSLTDPQNRALEFQSVVRSRVNMLESIKQGYGNLPAETLAQIDDAIATGKKVLNDVDTAEKIAIKLNRFERMQQTEASKGGMLPSRFMMSAMMSAGGAPGMAFAAAYNLPQLYRAASTTAAKGMRAGAAEFLGGPEQLVRWAHATRLRNQAGKHRLMMRVADAMDWLADTSHTRVRPTSGFKKSVAGALGTVAKTAETAAKYSPPIWTSGMDNKEKRSEYKKKAAIVTQLAQNPAMLSDGPMGAVAHVSPDLYRALADESIRRIGVVRDHLPGQTKQVGLKTQESLSQQDVRTGEMLLRVLDDPLVVIEDMKHGYLDYDSVKVAHLVAPESFRMARAAFLDLANNEEFDFEPTMNQIRQIDFVLGFNGSLDNSMEDVKLSGIAQTQQGGPSGPPRKAVSAEVAQNAETFTSQISNGIT